GRKTGKAESRRKTAPTGSSGRPRRPGCRYADHRRLLLRHALQNILMDPAVARPGLVPPVNRPFNPLRGKNRRGKQYAREPKEEKAAKSKRSKEEGFHDPNKNF